MYLVCHRKLSSTPRDIMTVLFRDAAVAENGPASRRRPEPQIHRDGETFLRLAGALM
jgi:hypothetical protein